MNPILVAVVTGLLSGGLAAGAGSFLTGRALVRKAEAEANAIDRKTPIEVDNIVVQGAEQAVILMDRALQSAKGRIKDLENERSGDRKKMAELEAKVTALEQKAADAETAARQARVELTGVREQLTTMVREQGSRK